METLVKRMNGTFPMNAFRKASQAIGRNTDERTNTRTVQQNTPPFWVIVEDILTLLLIKYEGFLGFNKFCKPWMVI